MHPSDTQPAIRVQFLKIHDTTFELQSRKHDIIHNPLLDPPIAHSISLCILVPTFHSNILQAPCTTVFPGVKYPCPGLSPSSPHLQQNILHKAAGTDSAYFRIFVFSEYCQLSTIASLRRYRCPSRGPRWSNTWVPIRALGYHCQRRTKAQNKVKHTGNLQNVENRPVD